MVCLKHTELITCADNKSPTQQKKTVYSNTKYWLIYSVNCMRFFSQFDNKQTSNKL